MRSSSTEKGSKTTLSARGGSFGEDHEGFRSVALTTIGRRSGSSRFPHQTQNVHLTIWFLLRDRTLRPGIVRIGASIVVYVCVAVIY